MVEALSSGGAIEFPLIHPPITLVQDYNLPLERYDDYEDDEGELRAESNLAEKFGESPHPNLLPTHYQQDPVSDYWSLTPGDQTVRQPHLLEAATDHTVGVNCCDSCFLTVGTYSNATAPLAGMLRLICPGS